MPTTCALCGAVTPDPVCNGCFKQFFNTTVLRCRICAIPTTPALPVCRSCLVRPPAFDCSIAACDYAPPLDQLVLSLKFGAALHQAVVMGEILARMLKLRHQTLTGLDLLLPVPLCTSRLRDRGFNQALEIARPLAARLALPLLPDALMRERETGPQSRLDAANRRANIHDAFSLNPRYRDKIRGRRLGVVDDVMTTGATLQEVARCLRRNGAAGICNIVFARTPPFA